MGVNGEALQLHVVHKNITSHTRTRISTTSHARFHIVLYYGDTYSYNKTEKSLKMKRDVGMVWPKRTQTRKDIKVKVNIQSLIHPYIFSQ